MTLWKLTSTMVVLSGFRMKALTLPQLPPSQLPDSLSTHSHATLLDSRVPRAGSFSIFTAAQHLTQCLWLKLGKCFDSDT